ncbi:ribonuclease H-like domain-containing protein [Tanacetum coccineum]
MKDSLEQPKDIRPSAPIIEEWESDSDDDCVVRPSFEQNKSILTKSGNVPVNTAKQSSPRAEVSNSTGQILLLGGQKREKVVKSSAAVLETTGKIIKTLMEDLLHLLEVLKEVKLLEKLIAEVKFFLLKVPRQNNKYSFDLKNVVPSGETPTKLNGVYAKERTRTNKAAKTMLSRSLLPTTFWAEAVNTACYVQNRVLVTKPHNKTSYELLHGIPPSISFMRPFGCPVTILNSLDPLGKFDRKADEGFLPVTCSKSTNGDAGIETNVSRAIGPGKASDHEYILLPLMLSNSSLSLKRSVSRVAGNILKSLTLILITSRRRSLNDIATVSNGIFAEVKWSRTDKQKSPSGDKSIDKKLKDRRLMRSLEKFVGVVKRYVFKAHDQPEPEEDQPGISLVKCKVLRFYTLAGNPVKEILLKLNLPDHRKLKDGGEGMSMDILEVPISQDGKVHEMAKRD